MPVITFPKGPNTGEEPQEDLPETGEIEVTKIASYFECPDCGSAAFFIYDDGEAQCCRCELIMANILVIDTDDGPSKERADGCA